MSLAPTFRTLCLACCLAGGAALANEELLELQQDPDQWVMANGSYSALNYSPLDQITAENVDQLQVAWTFQTGVLDSHEAAPLVVGDTMYLLTPKPSVLYAIDLNRPGVVKWAVAVEMPQLDQALAVACCGGQTRGPAYADGKVFFNTLDGQLLAVDAETGAIVWQQQVADLSIGETTTLAPLIVHDHLITGPAGGEYSIRGWVAAYDLETGEEVWRFYNTGPDDEMGIGDRWAPFYADDQVEEPGLSTWYRDSWQIGGASVWGWFSYDPELDMFYYSTGNCSPGNPDYRRDPARAPGYFEFPNKYCASLMARDATSGELVWAYSMTPQDPWDLDEPGQNLLVDLEIDGETVPALVKAARNGFFYVFDRRTGEILVEPWMHSTVTWATGFDMETGRPVMDPDREVYTDVVTEGLCPLIAATNWENQAYNPDTGLIYFSERNRCGDWRAFAGEYVPGESYRLRETVRSYLGPDGQGTWGNRLVGVDPVTGEQAWGIESMGDDNKPVFTTAGNLVFQGGQEGEFRAIDATTGEVLWQFMLGADFNNSPMTYMGPDGKQYVAVITSSGAGSLGVDANAPPDEEDRYRRAGSTLYVFTLPDDAAPPAEGGQDQPEGQGQDDGFGGQEDQGRPGGGDGGADQPGGAGEDGGAGEGE
jgi:PQQ-dependent dehydrogenase (methanol/ethanol family)